MLLFSHLFSSQSMFIFLISLSYLIVFSSYHLSPCLSVFPQSAFTCSKLTLETLEQGVKFVKS